MASPPKKKRKRRGRYKTGIHTSPKVVGGSLKYRSGWEDQAATYLDHDPTVVSYAYEAIAIPYVSNLSTGKIRHYYPDFLVTYTDGSRQLIEVKRGDRISQVKVMKKSQAGRDWCVRNGVEFVIWADAKIKAITLINERLGKH